MKRSQAFPSQYLAKEDVSSPVILHIAHVEMRDIGTEQEMEAKPVCQWEEPDAKPMILNGTNWQIIEAAYGPESDGWRGKTVEVYHDPSVMYMGKRVGGVRVRIPKPEQLTNPSF